MRDTLEWYQEQVSALRRHMDGGNAEACGACIAVLMMDGGKRAAHALEAAEAPAPKGFYATPGIPPEAVAELGDRIANAPSEDEESDVIAQVFVDYMQQQGAMVTIAPGILRVWFKDQYICKITTWLNINGSQKLAMLDLSMAREALTLLNKQKKRS